MPVADDEVHFSGPVTDVSDRSIELIIFDCDGVLIEDCSFDTGDDCISLKSGRDHDGRRLATPCRNVVIAGCHFSSERSAVSCGSESSGGIRDVFIEESEEMVAELGELTASWLQDPENQDVLRWRSSRPGPTVIKAKRRLPNYKSLTSKTSIASQTKAVTTAFGMLVGA